MSYTLQRTSYSLDVSSDLESIIGGTLEAPSVQGPSLSSRVRVLAGTAALAVVGIVLVVASSSNHQVQETKVSAAVGLSQDSPRGASWDQILLEEAHEIDASWLKLKADQDEFKRTGGWEAAHQIGKDHERLQMEEADFATSEAMSKQHPDDWHAASGNLRAAARSSFTAPVSTSLEKPASVSVHSQLATRKSQRNTVPRSTTVELKASTPSTEYVSTSTVPQQDQMTTSHFAEKDESRAGESTSVAKMLESSVLPNTTSTMQPAMPNAENLSALAEEFLAEAEKFNSTSSDSKSMTSIAEMLQKAAEKHFGKLPAQSSNTQHASLDDSPLVPKEALHDGNKCPDDEEEYPKSGGTCFKKCSDLTGGAFPIRSTAFSCCKSEPCGLGNSKIHLSFCGGFDVAGDAEGNGCPSTSGACLKDEELLGGICYKKCSSFEGGDVYYHRVAPNVCCRTKGMRCMLPKYFRVSTKFADGGGDGDGNSATPAIPHAPIQELTEVTA
eukprot:TRINITY_DN2828_c0_g1_i1.p1 TRINITY_DN2828_c0_g1~~TRINITY_DN2828_c0_g1_i1.p1  ORF type:complete len:516 (+),score=108.56 TRINITY_DN2828_c0_g1_i1:54-1550(+)